MNESMIGNINRSNAERVERVTRGFHIGASSNLISIVIVLPQGKTLFEGSDGLHRTELRL